MPGTQPRRAGDRLAASYVNFYPANGVVVVPLLDPRHDDAAVATLAALSPEREVVGVPAREILLGGGNIHCITQPVPARVSRELRRYIDGDHAGDRRGAPVADRGRVVAGLMVEIGTSGWPWHASGIAIGTALAAEADGAHVVWLADRIRASTPSVDRTAGPLLPLVPDPADVADPMVTASVAVLVTRRHAIGDARLDAGHPSERPRTLASLADLAPDRAVVALAGQPTTLRAVAAGDRTEPIELAVYGGAPDVAAGLGWGWIAPATPPDELAKAAGDAGVTATVGVHLPRRRARRRRRWRDAPWRRRCWPRSPRPSPADGMVVGDPDRARRRDRRVRRRSAWTRIVLDNLLAARHPRGARGRRATSATSSAAPGCAHRPDER